MTTGVSVFKPSGLKRVSRVFEFNKVQEPRSVFLYKLFTNALTYLLMERDVKHVTLSEFAQERATLRSL